MTQSKKRPSTSGKAPRKGNAPVRPQKKPQPRLDAKFGVKQTKPLDNQEKARDRPVPGNSPVQKDKRAKSNFILYVIIAALIVVIVLLLLRSCSPEGDTETTKKTPEYEESVLPDYTPDEDLKVDGNTLNLSVLPMMTVTKDKPDMLIPFPKQNFYDIDLTFVDPYTDEILYQTALISPGSTVSVPVYSFVHSGIHTYRVEVRAYDRETHDIVETAVAMETQIFKK